MGLVEVRWNQLDCAAERLMMLNQSHVEHAAIAVAIQVVIGLITGNYWIGAAAGIYSFIGREVTQAEYRWIKTYGEGKRANMPIWGGLDPRVWKWPEQSDAWLDWLVPTLACLAVACLIEFGF